MKKSIKRTLIFFLTFSVIFNLFVSGSYAASLNPGLSDDRTALSGQAEGSIQTAEEIYINPLYSDVMQEDDLLSPEPVRPDKAAAASEEVYLTSTAEAGEQMRAGMKQREESVVIYFETDEYSSALIHEISDQALIHTGNPVEGDYLRWQYGGWKTSTSYYTSNSRCFMTITYTITYYTTLQQEEEMDAAVADVLDELNVSDQSRYSKIKAVYDYICTHTVYDYDNLEDDDYKLKYTAYAALINGTAVCQGYALLFYRLTLELGVDSRLISGTGNGGAHGWNIVKADHTYYNADTTWDAGKSSYSYFLKCDADFADHVRDEEYSTEEFNASYPMADSNYDHSAAPRLSEPVISSVYSTVQTSVKVTWSPVEDADGYELYRSTDPDAVEFTADAGQSEGRWFRAKTIRPENIAQFTDSEGNIQYTNGGLEKGTTYYYKVRAYVSDEEGQINYSQFSDVDYMPAAVIFDNVYSNSDSRIRILWNEVDGSHGYQIWRKGSDGTYFIIKTLGDKGNELTDDQGKTTAYSNTGLGQEAGSTFTYRMRAFKIENGKKVFGTYSDEFTAAVMPSAPVLTVSSTKSQKAVLTWEAVSGAAGYQIWMADTEDGTYSIVKSIADGAATSYIKSGLVSGSTCVFKIRAYTEVNGKKTFGAYSSEEHVVIK